MKIRLILSGAPVFVGERFDQERTAPLCKHPTLPSLARPRNAIRARDKRSPPTSQFSSRQTAIFGVPFGRRCPRRVRIASTRGLHQRHVSVRMWKEGSTRIHIYVSRLGKKKKQKLFHVPYTFQRTRDIVEHAFTDRCDYSSTVLVMIHPSSCSPSSRCFFPFFSFLLFIGRFSFLGSDVASSPSFTFRFF